TYSGTSTIGRTTGINTASNTWTNYAKDQDFMSEIQTALSSSFYSTIGTDLNISAITSGFWDGTVTYDPSTGEGLQGSWSQTNTGFTLTSDFYGGAVWSDTPQNLIHIELSVTLSNPYNSFDCYSDWRAALIAWDMSNFMLAHFRTDGQL